MDRIRTKISDEIEVQYVLHGKPNKQGNYLIYVRFYILLKTVRVVEITVSTSVTTPQSKWTGESIRGTDIVARSKNERLKEILELVNDGLHLLKRIKIKSVETIKLEIERGLKPKITNKAPKGEKAKYLSQLAEHTLMTVKDSYLSTRQGCSETYKKNFRLAVQKIDYWWGLTYMTPAPNVHQITENDMESFKTWLKSQREITHNTAATYLNRLRTLFRHALKKKLITESPIHDGLIEGYKKGEQVALNGEELIKIKNIPDEELSESMKKVKYIFLFLCSTGMGYGELKSLRLEHIEQDGNDYIITKERNKTGQEFSLPLSETAKYIYTTYLNPLHGVRNVQPFERLFTIEYLTRKVKVLATMAGINKNLTTYVGRKTFATQWANDGNNIYYLAMILGHTKIETTMKYIRLDKKQMIEYSKEAFARNSFHGMITK